MNKLQFKVGDTVKHSGEDFKDCPPWIISDIYVEDGLLTIHDKEKQNLVNILIDFYKDIEIEKV